MATLEEALYGLNMSPADTGYGLATQAVSQATPQLINPYGSTGQAIGIGLGSILLQSLLGYQARQQAARNTLEMNTLANQMQSFATPQERTDFIAGIEDPIQQSRLSTLATALRAQEQKNAFDVERAKQLKIAEFEAAVSPEGREKQKMDLELLREQLGARLSRDIALENTKQVNRLEKQSRQADINKAQTELRQRLSDAAAKNKLTAGEVETLGNDYDAAAEIEQLADDLSAMSEIDAKASLSSVLGSQLAQQTGVFARYSRLKANFRNKLFGASLSGGESSSANDIFGESPLATKETAVLALRGISNQLINQAKNRLAIKQTNVPDLYNMFDSASRGEWRPITAPAQGEDIFAGASDATPTPAPAPAALSDAVARARAALADPNLSNETKQRIQNKLTELGVQE